jgi:hypothetical protein
MGAEHCQPVGPSTWTAGQQFRLGAIGNGWEGGRAYLTSKRQTSRSVSPLPRRQFFGDATTNVPITVLAPSNQAEFVSQQVPAHRRLQQVYNKTLEPKHDFRPAI